MRRFERLLWPLVTFAALAVAWQVAAGSASPEFRSLFPTPGDVGRAFAELASAGTLLTHVGASLVRFAAGYVAALTVAIPLGFLFGSMRRLWGAFDPLVQVLRPISPIAWFPLFSLWFGIGEMPAFVIIFIAAFYPALLTTVAAVRRIDSAYLKVARNFRAGRTLTVLGVMLPAALPAIATGARLAIGAAWIFLVAGEMLGVQSGLGFLIIDSRNALRTDMVVAAIAIIGVLGLALDQLVRVAESSLARAWGGGHA